MNISLNDILKLSSNEIYQKYKLFFDNVFYTYFYGKISFDDYLKIVYEEIENSKIDFNGSIRYDLFIKRRILQRSKSEDTYYENDIISAYIKDINNLEPYNKDEENDLILKAQNGDIEARNRIIEGNLKLVISIAKRYLNRGLSFEDLIQEGSFGFVKAINKYDFSKECKFSTYASWWIRQYITRYIDNKSKVVRLPVYLHDRIKNYKRAYYTLLQTLNREPTEEEIAKEMKISINMVKELALYSAPTSSLNEQIVDGEPIELQDLIPDESVSVDQTAMDNYFLEEVDNLLLTSKLTERELDVLKLRYGFNDNQPITLEEVGKKYGITRERVRQIENRALDKLRASRKILGYASYMDSPKSSFNNLKKVYDYMNNKQSPINSPKNEMYLNDDGALEKKRIKTIFSYFPVHRSRINNALARLDLLDSFFLYYRYGGNLDNPYVFELTENQKKYFEEELLPKIEKLINSLSLEKQHKNINSIILDSNTFNRNDYTALKMCFKNYRYLKKDYNCSLNHFFIEKLSDGFINKKAYSKEEIMQILHLTEEEYNDCIEEDKRINESLKTTKKLVKKP